MRGMIVALAVLLSVTTAMATPTTVTKTTAPGRYPTDGTNATLNSADVANGNRFLMAGNGKDLLVVYNPTGGSLNVSVSSVADATTGRSGDIETDAIGAAEMHVYGPFALDGWSSSGYLLFTMDSGLKAAVIELP